MKPRLAGLDVNGWRDAAVRNWAGGDDESEDRAAWRVDGGIGSVVVLPMGDRAGRESGWIGGAHAALAPHGRGNGWGEVGRPERRRRVRDHLGAPHGSGARSEDGSAAGSLDPDVLAAAVGGLTPGADVGVLAIPDERGYDETDQERALAALRVARVRRPLLVWRTVLAVLHEDVIAPLPDRARVGVISHGPHGLALQTLIMRRRPNDSVAAPERRGAARRVAPEFGLSALAATAARRVLAECDAHGLDQVLPTARAPVAAALGEPANSELVRLDNGAWTTLRPPDLTLPDALDLDGENFAGCDAIVLETVAQGGVAAMLHQAVESALGHAVMLLKPDAVARGAWVAAGRLARGEPVYFDHLPRIRTIAMVGSEPKSRDLIDADEALPAGETYRTPVPVRFAWHAGDTHVDLFLDREGSGAPRRATIPVERGPDATVGVELALEQEPAGGRARLILSSREWDALRDHPRAISFEEAKIEVRSWDEIIESLRRPPPGHPERMVLPCGRGPWIGRAGGASGPALATLVSDRHATWKALSEAIRGKRPETRGSTPAFALDSDGRPPSGVPIAALDARLSDARAVVMARAARIEPNTDNDALGFATWAFRRCPGDVVAEIVRALREAGHPFHAVSGARTLLYHGLGRTARDEHMNDAVAILRALPDAPDEWKLYHRAFASFLLARHDAVHPILERSDIDRLVSVVTFWLPRAAEGPSWTDLGYTAALLGGILRYRIVEPYVLIATEDAAADRLSNALRETTASLETAQPVSKRDNMLELLKSLQQWLDGSGRPPGILSALIIST